MQRIKKKYIVFFVLMVGCFAANAQTANQYINTGNHYYKADDFYGAAQAYEKALNVGGDGNILLLHKLANSLRQYNQYQQAAEYYLELYKIDQGHTYPKDVFYLAEMYKYLGQYRYASRYLRRSRRFFIRQRNSYFYKKIEQEIASCAYADKIKDSTRNISFNNLEEVNTPDAEFAPRLLNDSVLLFSSIRSKALSNNIDSNYTSKIYFAKLKSDIWKTDSLFKNNLGIKYRDIANASVSPDGQYLYVTLCDTDKHCEIWRSNKDGNSWTSPKKINIIDGAKFTSTQAFPVNINGNGFLFFTSDRPGGKGKMDIWYSYVNAFGEVSKPINAGDSINTPGNEITPFYCNHCKKLYFSSDWWKGLGGFDIFESKGIPGSFHKPENLLPPINTSTNDLYFALYKNFAFLTSNRTGSKASKAPNCCNDIYAATLKKPVKKEKVDTFSTIQQMNKYLPLTLYFDNDYPNPRSHDTTTNVTYLQTYLRYMQQEKLYETQYSEGLSGQDKKDAVADIDDFFSEKVHHGFRNLQKFTALLMKELKNGYNVQLTIKGFASPLTNSNYNVNLTMRRISSLINYFRSFHGSPFAPYIDGMAKNGARLTFKEIPYGEYESSKLVSDNIHDLRNSVYSIKASLQRKIEIIAVEHKGKKESTFSGKKIQKGPKTLILSKPLITQVPPIGTRVHFQFKIKNVGDTLLQIFTFDTISVKGLSNIKIHFTEDVPPNKTETIKIEATVTGKKVFARFKMRTNEGKVWKGFQKVMVDTTVR